MVENAVTMYKAEYVAYPILTWVVLKVQPLFAD